MARRALLVLALAVGGCANLRLECRAHHGDPVLAVRSDHFRIVSDLPEPALVKEAGRLELLWDTFAAYFRGQVDAAAIPVVVVNDVDKIAEFWPEHSGFMTRRGPDVLLVGAPSRKKHHGSNAHEMAHLVSTFFVRRQPRWLSEGLATYFEDATFVDDGMVTMGRWNDWRAQGAHTLGVLDLRALAAWEVTDAQSEERLYASAWAYVHYLSNHEELRLLRFFEELNGARPLDEVVRAVFGDDPTALVPKVEAYVRAARFRGFRTTLSRTPKLSPLEPLSDVHVHLLRQRLHLFDERAATGELATAGKLAGKDAPWELAVARAQLDESQAATLPERYPQAPRALALAASLTKDAARRAELAAQAVRLAPSDAWVRWQAAEAALAAGAATEALEHATAGLAAAPWSAELARAQAVARLRLKDCSAAKVAADVALSLAGERPSEGYVSWHRRFTEEAQRCSPPAPAP